MKVPKPGTHPFPLTPEQWESLNPAQRAAALQAEGAWRFFEKKSQVEPGS